MTNPGHFGPLVIGEEAYEQEREVVETARNKFGPLVTGDDPKATASGEPSPTPGATAPPEEPQEEPKEVPDDVQEYMVSVRKLEEILDENPLLVDEFLHAELQRPDGIRKTAVAALRKAEERRDDGARQEVLDVLDEWEEQAG